MTVKNDLISIIIPSYNRATLLKRAIDSILIQKYIEIEILVVDNYSTDSTSELIKNYNNKIIKFIRHKNNGNIASSRNVGIQQSKGKWIAFLDSDDWWHKSKLSILSHFLNDNNDIIYHKMKIVYESNKNFVNGLYLQSGELKSPVIENLLIKGNIINNSSVVVRASLLKKIGGISENREFITAEDYHTWLKLSKFTEKFCYIPKSLGYYYIHEENTLRNDMSIPTAKVINEFVGFLDNKKIKVLYAKLNYMSGRYHFKNKDFNQSQRKLLKSKAFLPINMQIKTILMISYIRLFNIFSKEI